MLDKAGVQALASIPAAKRVVGPVLGVMKAPVSGFAVALGALAKQRESDRLICVTLFDCFLSYSDLGI